MPRVSKEKRIFFMEAYNAHGDAIFRHCYFRLFNRDRAKEIMQDTFMRTWEQIVKGTDILNIKAFLYRIATNLIIDETRKKKTESLDVLQEKGFNPSFTTIDAIFNSIDLGMVKEVLYRIDSKYRDVIVMRYLNDLSVKEIASIMDISQNVISVRIHRGLKEVKKILAYEKKL
jgi:RNA polymerase sigma-70 factor, ECF subfamily